MGGPAILALDFDGVLCDGIREYFESAWRTYRRLRPGTPPAPPRGLVERFARLRPLVESGWVAVRAGEDRRERLVAITAAGAVKLEQARPAWERAQQRMRSLLPESTCQELMTILSQVVRRTVEA